MRTAPLDPIAHTHLLFVCVRSAYYGWMHNVRGYAELSTGGTVGTSVMPIASQYREYCTGSRAVAAYSRPATLEGLGRIGTSRDELGARGTCADFAQPQA